MLKKTLPFVLYLILSAAAVVLICKYLHRQSREFYFWDSAGYENIVIALEKSWSNESKADFFRHIYHSFADEISYLFALPLLEGEKTVC